MPTAFFGTALSAMPAHRHPILMPATFMKRAASSGDWRDYLFAVGAVAAALALRYLLNPVLGQQGPYLILTMAIVVAALYGGFGPAVLATVLSTLIGTWLFIGDRIQELLLPSNIWRTMLFFAIGLSISVIGGRLRKSQLALAVSVRELRAGSRLKDNALAMLAHEIRNPLAALRSAVEVLKLAPRDPNASCGPAISSVARCVDLRTVLQQALEQSGPLIERKRHVLRTDLGTAPTEVIGDPHRLVQIFANLLNNAAKYTPAGGGLSLVLQRQEPRATVVSVADNGVGMEPESIAELFEPFVQAPGAAANDEAGLGLGLAIVKKIVELHGGSVEAHSPGLRRGSTVVVRLPLAG